MSANTSHANEEILLLAPEDDLNQDDCKAELSGSEPHFQMQLSINAGKEIIDEDFVISEPNAASREKTDDVSDNKSFKTSQISVMKKESAETENKQNLEELKNKGPKKCIFLTKKYLI